MLISELRMKFEAMNANKMRNPEQVEKNTERLLQLIQVLIGAECLDQNEMRESCVYFHSVSPNGRSLSFRKGI